MLTTKFLIICAMPMLAAATLNAADRPSLAERLGYKPTDKLLIVNGDDAGMCHAANLATTEAMEKGLMSSATIMVPCPWFPEIAGYAKAHPDKDFGVHLCHTAEWGKYRWGPVAPREQVPGLVDPEGYMWRGVLDVYSHATPEQALIEGRAQIRRAQAAGVDITHLDSHMGTLQLQPGVHEDILAVGGGVRSASPHGFAGDLCSHGASRSARAVRSQKGIVFPDYFVYEELKEEKTDVRGFWLETVRNLKPGDHGALYPCRDAQ